jgi:DNA (cytosine-5)-methyltransferase 1
MVRKDKSRAGDIRVLSLFSGGGGLDIGFARAGFHIITSSEIETLFCETLDANKPTFGQDHKVICEDIAKFNPTEHALGRIDFVIGGPPCQSFSAAGRRAGGVYGINDLRGSLFWHYCRILKELSPTGFLFENVRGILSANNKTAWGVIQEEFAALGYSLRYRVVDAAEYGVPQHRERVIMVGSKQGSSFLFPRPTHGPASAESRPYFGAREAVSDLQNKDEKPKPYGGMYEELLLEIPPGSNYLHFTEKMNHPHPRFAWRSRFSDFLYVADPDKPTKTIVAHPGKWAGPFHWNKRKFTIAELKRLFTFPDDYTITGSELQVIRQLGNSVPPRLGYCMALAIKNQFFGGAESIELVPGSFVFDHDKRKARKAASTKRQVRPNEDVYPGDQALLFDFTESHERTAMRFEETLNYVSSRHVVQESLGKTTRSFFVKATLESACWSVEVKDRETTERRLNLTLDFNKVIQGNFRKIAVALVTDDCEYICAAWDAVDLCIRKSTSYDNIQKLYGHFTEPYPQFRTSVDSDLNHPLVRFARQLCNYEYLAGYHALADLESQFERPFSGVEIAKWLRDLGYDVRTKETNRTTPEGCFRVCYPFTMPINSKRFVSWIERGRHKTADRTSIPTT